MQACFRNRFDERNATTVNSLIFTHERTYRGMPHVIVDGILIDRLPSPRQSQPEYHSTNDTGRLHIARNRGTSQSSLRNLPGLCQSTSRYLGPFPHGRKASDPQHIQAYIVYSSLLCLLYLLRLDFETPFGMYDEVKITQDEPMWSRRPPLETLALS